MSNETKPWEISGHITEIKITLAEMNVHMQEMKKDLKEHSDKSLAMQNRVEKIERKIDKAEGSLVVMRWMVPTMPAIIMVVIKALGLL